MTTKIAEEQKVTLFDGVFDGKDPGAVCALFPDPQPRIAWTHVAQPHEKTNPPPVAHRSVLRWPRSPGGRASVLVPDLPSPVRTWDESKLYIMEPLVKRGEMDQGIALLAYYSLLRVAQGFLLGILIGTPLGLPARRVAAAVAHVRSADPDPAADLAAGLAAARPRSCSRSRSRRRSSPSPCVRCGRPSSTP